VTEIGSKDEKQAAAARMRLHRERRP